MLIICIHKLSMKRKSFVFRKCNKKNNMFIKQKRVKSSYNPFLKKYLYTANEKNILTQSMEKEKINSSEIFPIVYSLLSLHIILSIFITLHFFNWLSSCCNLLLLTRSKQHSFSKQHFLHHALYNFSHHLLWISK